MEAKQFDQNRIFAQRKVFIEESLYDPYTNVCYCRSITSEETYGVPSNTNVNNIEDNFEETPMDVDPNSSKERLINTIHKIEDKHIKRRKCNISDVNTTLIPIESPPVASTSFKLLLSLTILFVLVAIYVVTTGDRFIHVDKKLQAENLKLDLKQSLHYQNSALRVLIKNIDRMKVSRKGVNMLPLIGTTGVGKTHTVNIFKKHFFPQLIHEVTNMQQQKHRIVKNLHSCCCNLIIIDNLKAHHLDTFAEFVQTLPESYDILIIPIFNIHDTSDGVIYRVNEEDFDSIRRWFDKAAFYYDLVIYDNLDRNVIEKWLRRELSNKKIDEMKHDALVRSILNDNNVKYRGFKALDLRQLMNLS